MLNVGTSKKKLSNTTWTVLVFLSGVLGLALSLYLLVQHTRLKTGIQETQSFCALGKFADCDVVNMSSYSEIGGIPLAALGALLYFLLVVLFGLARASRQPANRIDQIGLVICALGITVDILLFFIQAVVLKNFCLVCLATYACTFGLALSWVRTIGFGKQGLPYKNLFKTLLPKVRVAPWIWGLSGLAILCFAGALAMIPSAIRIRSQTYSFVDTAIEQFFLQWKERPSKRIEIGANGTFGNPAARVQIVEFSDFQCPHCRNAAFTLHTLLKLFKDRVYFVFKNYPLDSACNSAVPYAMHPHACSLAKLSFCAQKKEKFWNFHDYVFFTLSEASKAKKTAYPESLRPEDFSSLFTEEEFLSCLRDASALKAVQSDIKQGNELGLKGTPTVYLNGKLVTVPLTLEILQRLIEIEEGK